MIAQTGNTIDILLATYNGEVFLEEQLDSIVAQTHGDWRLIARDDGSTDRTPEILSAFRARHPDKVVVLEDGDGNLGLVQNFSRLMEHSDAPCAAYCDQDDVWIPEKLELSLAKMRELERKHGTEVPLLVFTDLTVVDEELKVIDPSFWHFARLRPDRCNSLNRLLLQNVVTGCAALMNRNLIAKSIPIPVEAVVHDWWIALVAAAFGVAAYVRQPAVLYRQHGRNMLGARPANWRRHTLMMPVYAFRFCFGKAKGRRTVQTLFRQGCGIFERYFDQSSDQTRQILSRFIDIQDRNIIKRTYVILRYSYGPTGFLNFVRDIIYSSK